MTDYKKLTKTRISAASNTALAVAVIFLGIASLVAAGVGIRGTKQRTVVVPKKQGTWLVLNLEQAQQGKFKVNKAYLQNYNITQKDFFDKIFSRVSPLERNFTHKLVVKQERKSMGQYFASVRPFIAENFDDFDRIKMTDYKLEKLETIQVKVALNRNINPNKGFEVWTTDLKTGKRNKILAPVNSLKLFDNSKIVQKIDYGKIAPPFFVEPFADSGFCSSIKSAIQGHNQKDNKNQVNIIFMGANFDESYKGKFVDKYIPYLLGTDKKIVEFVKVDSDDNTEPFASNFDKFNIWYWDKIDYPIDEQKTSDPCNCRKYIKEDVGTSIGEQCGLDNTKIVVLCNKNCRSAAQVGGLYSEISTKPYDYNYLIINEEEKLETPEEFFSDFYIGANATLMHETGHQFGFLVDEYTEMGKSDLPSFPNCSDTTEQGYVWWGDLYPDMEFYNGCSYTEDNFNFNQLSTMGSLLYLKFGEINELYICYELFWATGEFGGVCEDKLLNLILND